MALTTISETATITIDQQQRHNALDVSTCEQLAAEFQDAVDGGTRAIVLTGAGAQATWQPPKPGRENSQRWRR